MPAVKNKKKKVKKEVVDEEEQGEGEGVTVTTTCSLNENVFYHPVFLFCFLLFCSVLVALDVEMEEVINRSHSDSRDPLTPEPQDLAPQKKKKKKKAPTVGNKTFTSFNTCVKCCDPNPDSIQKTKSTSEFLILSFSLFDQNLHDFFLHVLYTHSVSYYICQFSCNCHRGSGSSKGTE